jgi:hypothetical protein
MKVNLQKSAFLPVNQLMGQKVQSWICEYDKNLQQNKNDHQKSVDAFERFVALFWNSVAHVEEFDELQKETGARGQAKNDGSKSNSQTSVALKKYYCLPLTTICY